MTDVDDVTLSCLPIDDLIVDSIKSVRPSSLFMVELLSLTLPITTRNTTTHHTRVNKAPDRNLNISSEYQNFILDLY